MRVIPEIYTPQRTRTCVDCGEGTDAEMCIDGAHRCENDCDFDMSREVCSCETIPTDAIPFQAIAQEQHAS